MFFVALAAGTFDNYAYLLGVFAVTAVGAYPFVSLLMTGRWPFSSLLGLILGSERSMQRSIVLTLAFSFPFIVMLYGLNGASVAFAIRALVTLGIMFYLTGTASTWRAAGTEVRVVNDFGFNADAILSEVEQDFRQQRFRPLSVQTITVLEDTSFALSREDAARRTVRLLEVTHDRARVTLRCVDYHGHLYVRWDTFMEHSGTRFLLIWKSFVRIVSAFFTRITGSDIGVWLSELSDILFGARASTGGQPMQTALGAVEYVPSWVADNLNVLQQIAALLIVSKAINGALERSHRQDRTPLPEFGGRRRIL